MLHIAICDDETLHREHTVALVQRLLAERQTAVECFDNGPALLRTINAGDYAPDIAVLDIQMAELDGIALAKSLNELTPDCRIIFLTGYLDFATEVYETRHAYFVLKTQAEERMGSALAKALSALADDEPSLHYKNGAAAHILPARAVLYLERRLHRTRIVKTDGEDWTTTPPAELLAALPPERFIRCHQSFWVNASFIAELAKGAFILTNGERIPISRTYQTAAKDAFFSRLFAARQ